MTEKCRTCLGCQALEDPKYQGTYRCHAWVDCREPEPEQVKIDEIMPEQSGGK
jgi:hypothetical protein